jgi:hypothetical protein
VLEEVTEKLDENFEFSMLRKVITETQALQADIVRKREYEKVFWLADAYYELAFSLDTDISDRVIFPISEFERKGIEDARFVRFTEADRRIVYYTKYTA